MTSKREKLQYAYVFLTDFVTTGISVVLAWLITDNVFNKLQDYATFDWIQALCLLLLAFVLTFLCFDQDQNIVTRSKGDEIILALKFNVVLGVVNAACLVLAKATLLDSRYFAVMVPIVNVVLMPITHGLLKKFLLKLQHSRGSESLVGFVTTGDRAEKLIAEIRGDWSRRIIGVALLEATPRPSAPGWPGSRSRQRLMISWPGCGARRWTRSMWTCRWTAARASSPTWKRWKAWA